jgi:hypothetical protein
MKSLSRMVSETTHAITLRFFFLLKGYIIEQVLGLI